MESLRPCTATRSTPVSREDMRAGVARRRVLAVGVRRAPWGARGCGGGGGLGGERAARRAPRESLCAVCSALAQLGGGAIAAGERGREDTAMRLAPGARQRQRDCGRRLLAARVAEGGERVRGARTGDDGAEDARPGVPRDIAERLGPRDMPLQERLVPVEDMGSPMLEEWGTKAEAGAQRHAVRVRPQRGRQQPIAVAGLNPLTVQDGTLAPRPARDGRGTEEATVQAAGCEGLAQRHPIDAREVPGDRLDVTVHPPVRQGLQSRSGGATGADDLLRVAVGHPGHHLLGATVDACGMRVALAHALAGADCALGRFSPRACAPRAHGGPPVQEKTRPHAITRDHRCQ